MDDKPRRGETAAFATLDEAAFHPCLDTHIAGEERDDDADCKQPDDDYEQAPDGVIRYGNNRKHVTKEKAKARRKLAKASKRKNRK